MARHAELANQEDVERRGQDPGHLGGDGHPAPGQAEDQQGPREAVEDAGLDEAPAEHLAGVSPVPVTGSAPGAHRPSAPGYASRRCSSSANSGK